MTDNKMWAMWAVLAGCASEATSKGGDTALGGEATYTYYRDAKAIVDARCAGCHQEGDIAPFPLTTYDEIVPLAAAVRSSVEEGRMPPWKGVEGCNDYTNDSSLSAEERAVLLGWLDEGAVAGDPADTPPPVEDEASIEVDLTLTLPEAYTPQQAPDDYRCQLVAWPLEETAWITGIDIVPDKREIVHHAILFAASADGVARYQEMDAAEEGPGYTCFGGPNATTAESPLEDLSLAELLELIQQAQSGEGGGESLAGGQRWLGAWVPGASARPFPEGTGLRMEPGDMLIVQMHYNTLSSDPVADQSSIAVQLADSVEREAMVLPVTDLGWISGIEALGEPMDIPAGDSDVSHTTEIEGAGLFPASARRNLGLDEDAPLVIHSVGHHMHQLGRTGDQSITHADGSETCLVDIDDWDFAWQGDYRLAEPAVLRPEDRLSLGCSWDNSAENQPLVDGSKQQPVDVSWGEGSLDEMCLSTLYITGE